MPPGRRLAAPQDEGCIGLPAVPPAISMYAKEPPKTLSRVTKHGVAFPLYRDKKTGTVMWSRMVRVLPPSTYSRSREWP